MLELAEMKEAQTSSELLKKLKLNPRDIQRFRATVKTAHDAVLLKGSIQGRVFEETKNLVRNKIILNKSDLF